MHRVEPPCSRSSDFALSIAEAARTLNKPRSLDDTLQTIVEVACNSVPGFDHVGIATLQMSAHVETRALTGDLVCRLDAIQYDLLEGPCSAALQGDDGGVRVELHAREPVAPATCRMHSRTARAHRWRSSCTSTAAPWAGSTSTPRPPTR